MGKYIGPFELIADADEDQAGYDVTIRAQGRSARATLPTCDARALGPTNAASVLLGALIVEWGAPIPLAWQMALWQELQAAIAVATLTLSGKDPQS